MKLSYQGTSKSFTVKKEMESLNQNSSAESLTVWASECCHYCKFQGMDDKDRIFGLSLSLREANEKTYQFAHKLAQAVKDGEVNMPIRMNRNTANDDEEHIFTWTIDGARGCPSHTIFFGAVNMNMESVYDKSLHGMLMSCQVSEFRNLFNAVGLGAELGALPRKLVRSSILAPIVIQLAQEGKDKARRSLQSILLASYSSTLGKRKAGD
jgi:hypothetical protein